MNKTHSIQIKNSVRFRHWTRAGYAVFASLAVTVTIGVLSAGVAEKSLLKSNVALAGFSQNNVLLFAENENVEEILQELVAEIAVTEQTSDIAAAENRNLLYINHNRLNENISFNRFYFYKPLPFGLSSFAKGAIRELEFLTKT